MKTVPTQIRIDKNLKDHANKIFNDLGLDMSSAVNIFLKQCVLRRGLPFKVEIPAYTVFDQSTAEAGKDQQPKEISNWTKDVLDCIDHIPKTKFTLKDVYKFVPELSIKHPNNHTIEAKIRQELQYLRDLGYIEFLERGNYRKNY